jgi:hypothetical protein
MNMCIGDANLGSTNFADIAWLFVCRYFSFMNTILISDNAKINSELFRGL